MYKSDVSAMEQVVLGTILSFPEGATQDDIERVLQQRYRSSNFTARLSSLKRKGLIQETGDKRTGFSGRKQKVLEATLL